MLYTMTNRFIKKVLSGCKDNGPNKELIRNKEKT